MYQKAKNSWIKHIDFVILDILCLQVSFFLAYLVTPEPEFILQFRVWKPFHRVDPDRCMHDVLFKYM